MAQHSRGRTQRVRKGSLTAKLIAYYFAAYDARGYDGAYASYQRAGRALERRGRVHGNSRYQADAAFWQAAYNRFRMRTWGILGV